MGALTPHEWAVPFFTLVLIVGDNDDGTLGEFLFLSSAMLFLLFLSSTLASLYLAWQVQSTMRKGHFVCLFVYITVQPTTQIKSRIVARLDSIPDDIPLSLRFCEHYTLHFVLHRFVRLRYEISVRISNQFPMVPFFSQHSTSWCCRVLAWFVFMGKERLEGCEPGCGPSTINLHPARGDKTTLLLARLEDCFFFILEDQCGATY